MSISWSRLLPQAVKGSSPSSEGVKFYRAVFKELKDNGIEPAVTLYHWDMPQVCLLPSQLHASYMAARFM
jgi:beta-glucosidase